MSDESDFMQRLQELKPQYFQDGPVTRSCAKACLDLLEEEREAWASTLETFRIGAASEKKVLLAIIAELKDRVADA